MDSGADDLVVGQASQPAHSLDEEGRNWLALIQLACSHILLNLAVFG
jgi:hypothetical protein